MALPTPFFYIFFSRTDLADPYVESSIFVCKNEASENAESTHVRGGGDVASGLRDFTYTQSESRSQSSSLEMLFFILYESTVRKKVGGLRGWQSTICVCVSYMKKWWKRRRRREGKEVEYALNMRNIHTHELWATYMSQLCFCCCRH